MGNISYSQYSNAASGVIENMLQSTAIIDGDTRTNGSYSDIVYVTGTGLEAFRRTTATGATAALGYVDATTLAHGITCVCYAEIGSTGYWFFGTDDNGVYQIADADLFDTNSEVSADCSKPSFTGISNPGQPVDDITSNENSTSGYWYLQFTIDYYGYLVDLETLLTCYRAVPFDHENGHPWRHQKNYSVNGVGDWAMNYGVTGVKLASNSVSATSWELDTAFGNLSDDFSDNVLRGTLTPFVSGEGALVSDGSGGYNYELSRATVSGAGFVSSYTYGPVFYGQPCSIKVTGLTGDWTDITNGRTMTNCLRLIDQTNSLSYRVCATTGMDAYTNLVTSFSYEVRNNSGVLYSGSTTPAIGTFTDADKLCIEISGTSVAFKYYQSSSWTTMYTYTASSNPQLVMLSLFLQFYNMDTLGGTWEICSIENDGAAVTLPDIVSEFPSNSENTAVKVFDRMTLTSYIPIAFACSTGGVIFGYVDPSSPYTFVSGLTTTFGAASSGADYEILTTNNILGIDGRYDQTTGEIRLLCATALGIDMIYYSGFAATPVCHSFTTLRGKLIDDITATIACDDDGTIYGTGSGASTAGGGWFSEDFTPIDDVDFFARGVNLNEVMLAWEVPTDDDFDHAKLYRRVNGGTWNYRTTSNSWDTTGDYLEFDDAKVSFRSALFDQGLSESRYEYKLTVIDLAGNESDGSLSGKKYIDVPAITAAESGSYDNTRAGLAEVDGNSGPSSGAEDGAGCIAFIDVKQVPQAWTEAITFDVREQTPPYDLPFHLTGAAGTKILNYRARSESGKTSTTQNVSFDLQTDSETGIQFDRTENIMVAFDVFSDDYTPQGDTDATTDNIENVADERPSMAYDPGTDGCVIAWDFVSAKTPALFFIHAHNLYANACNVYLCGSSSWEGLNPPDTETWTTNSAYVVRLSNLRSQRTIVHMPNVSYRYWALVVTKPAVAGEELLIGRVGFVNSSGYWQPETNFRLGHTQSVRDESRIRKTEGRYQEGSTQIKRFGYRMDFGPLTYEDAGSIRETYLSFGRAGSLLVVPDPAEIATGDTDPSYGVYDNPPIYAQTVRDYEIRNDAQDPEHVYYSFEVEEDSPIENSELDYGIHAIGGISA